MPCRFCGGEQELQRTSIFRHIKVNDLEKDIVFVDIPHYFCYNCYEMSFEPVKNVLLKILDFAFSFDYNVVIFTENDDVG